MTINLVHLIQHLNIVIDKRSIPFIWSLKTFLAIVNLAECKGTLSCINIIFNLKLLGCKKKHHIQELRIIICIYIDTINLEGTYNFNSFQSIPISSNTFLLINPFFLLITLLITLKNFVAFWKTIFCSCQCYQFLSWLFYNLSSNVLQFPIL